MGEMIFSDPLKLNAIRFGEKEAISYLDRRFTYKQLNDRVNKLAHALQSEGVKKGDKVAFMLFNCNELVETMFACGKIGAIFIPINARFVGREIAHIVNNSKAALLIYDIRFEREVVKATEWAKSIQNFVSVGGNSALTNVEYEQWIGQQKTEEPTPDVSLQETDTICYLYTGGTTGLPKGAVRSHRSLYLVSLLFSIEFEIGRNGKGLVVGPLFGAASLAITLPNFFVGNPVHLLERFNPEEVLRKMDEEKTTTTFLAPPMLDAIFSLPEEIREKYDVSTMESIISVGAPLMTATKEQTLQFFPGIKLNEFYGASEHGGSTNLFPEYMALKDRSVGLPMLGMEVKIVDEAGNEVKQGEVGEIVVKGITLCDGYYENEQANEEAFRDGWLGLGDLGRQDEEGFYYLVDRKQDMILSGAFNVYPAELEEVLHLHDNVAEAAVIGKNDAKWGEVPVAVIRLKDPEATTEEDILTFCRGNMASYKIPHEVIFVEELLPRSLQGKVLKFKLRETFID